MVAAKDLANRLGSENLGARPATRLAHRSPTVSTCPLELRFQLKDHRCRGGGRHSTRRHEPDDTKPLVLNARIRKQWLRSDLEVGLVGEDFESYISITRRSAQTPPTSSPRSTVQLGQEARCRSERPMIIVGSAAVEHSRC